MDKLAFLFPGQGSQKVGMGSELLAADPDIYDRYLTLADEVSGLPVRQLSLSGPMDDLTRTDVAQPALFALALAVEATARDIGLRPDFVAGHSLGEYTAAVASGSLDATDGMRLVSERGRLMSEVQSVRPGAMAAIIGLTVEAVQDVCARAADAGVVQLANLNSPTQIVISGEKAAVARAIEIAQGDGAQRALPLPVGAAFHSALMKPVQEELAKVMDGVEWRDAEIPLVANHNGQAISSGADIHEALVIQIASPVRWVDCVRTLVDGGVRTFVEIGSGRVLSGLVKKIAPEALTFAADSRKKLSDFAGTRDRASRVMPVIRMDQLPPSA
ncbi:MAG: [acyl-carrier-protein] S-malonyltransferase [Thermoleophilaceae bacterium]|nr:[acyl-carrier-protein] S-malonyltransferase [Thermoleophilaceae bacterium]